MRIEQTARVFGLTLTLAMAVSACGSVLQAPDSGTDARPDGAGVACGQLNETAVPRPHRLRGRDVRGPCGGPRASSAATTRRASRRPHARTAASSVRRRARR